MTGKQLKKLKLPEGSGVYFFKQKGKILYIGKATSLRDRVKSYFGKDVVETRGPHIVDMVFKATTITWQETDSVLEALILEANLIKKHQPYYNTKEKDDKSFNYVVITKPASTRGGEEIPQVLVVRGRDLEKKLADNSWQIAASFGPFTSGGQLKEAMKIIRRIFPYIDASSSKKDNKEFYRQLGLTPSNLKIYLKNLKNIKLFFQGKTQKILTSLKKEMMQLAKRQEFEQAGEIKRQIFALEHINDTALIKNDSLEPRNSNLESNFRIESYDIAHMSGKNMVGVMTVVTNGMVDKNEYRKFIIRTQKGANDIGALHEVLSRRFRHTEWGIPNIILMDGGEAQLRIGKQVLNRYQLDIPVLSVVKDDRHRPKDILGDEVLAKKYKRALLLANSESHRFGITFHKKKRAKAFLH